MDFLGHYYQAGAYRTVKRKLPTADQIGTVSTHEFGELLFFFSEIYLKKPLQRDQYSTVFTQLTYRNSLKVKFLQYEISPSLLFNFLCIALPVTAPCILHYQESYP